ncbi:MAG TPA: molybdopterin-dependent oxidoreductase, partial [Pseudolabrys sp.]|nr:molybdopterin-dependent oxidoreductase [Pseudolabrys sp.]
MLNRRFPHLSRREFNVLAGAAGLSAGFGGVSFAADTPDSAAIIHGKISGMIVHNAQLGVMETPLVELRKHAHTPKDILFNRFHFPHQGDAAWYATTSVPSADMAKNWTLRVDGLVERPRDVTIAQLQAAPQEKRVSVLQCAGNGRAYYAAKQK